MHRELGVLTTEIIRRDHRGRRIGIGEAARLAGQLLDGASATSDAASSFVLELEQIDPLEPNVRAAALRVHAAEDVDRDEQELRTLGTGDRLLTARVLLAAG